MSLMRFDPELMPRCIIRGMGDIEKANEVHPKAGSVVTRGGVISQKTLYQGVCFPRKHYQGV